MFLKFRLSKQISASLPDILTQFTSEYFNREKQDSSLRLIDARPGSSSLQANNHGGNGSNTKPCTFGWKDQTVPLTEKEIKNLTIPALKYELAKRNLPKQENKQTLDSRLKSSLQSIRQKTSFVSDQTDTPLLCTARDETNNSENCPCLLFY